MNEWLDVIPNTWKKLYKYVIGVLILNGIFFNNYSQKLPNFQSFYSPDINGSYSEINWRTETIIGWISLIRKWSAIKIFYLFLQVVSP